MSETPTPNPNGASPLSLRYPHNTVARATVDGTPDVLTMQIADPPSNPVWLAWTKTGGQLVYFPHQVENVVPLVTLTATDMHNMIDAIGLGATQEAVEFLGERLELISPEVIEPTGQGASVVDVWGERFIRLPEAEDDSLPWYSVNGYYVGWFDIVEPVIEWAGAA